MILLSTEIRSLGGAAVDMSLWSLSEEGEIDTAIAAVLHEMRMLGEIVVFAVFKDEDAVCCQKAMTEDEVWNRGKLFQRVRRVSKDEVELLVAMANKLKHISPETLRVES